MVGRTQWGCDIIRARRDVIGRRPPRCSGRHGGGVGSAGRGRGAAAAPRCDPAAGRCAGLPAAEDNAGRAGGVRAAGAGHRGGAGPAAMDGPVPAHTRVPARGLCWAERGERGRCVRVAAAAMAAVITEHNGCSHSQDPLWAPRADRRAWDMQWFRAECAGCCDNSRFLHRTKRCPAAQLPATSHCAVLCLCSFSHLSPRSQ